MFIYFDAEMIDVALLYLMGFLCIKLLNISLYKYKMLLYSQPYYLQI